MGFAIITLQRDSFAIIRTAENERRIRHESQQIWKIQAKILGLKIIIQTCENFALINDGDPETYASIDLSKEVGLHKSISPDVNVQEIISMEKEDIDIALLQIRLDGTSDSKRDGESWKVVDIKKNELLLNEKKSLNPEKIKGFFKKMPRNLKKLKKKLKSIP